MHHLHSVPVSAYLPILIAAQKSEISRTENHSWLNLVLSLTPTITDVLYNIALQTRG